MEKEEARTSRTLFKNKEGRFTLPKIRTFMKLQQLGQCDIVTKINKLTKEIDP